MIRITQTGSYLANEANICNKSEFDFDYSCNSKEMSESSVY